MRIGEIVYRNRNDFKAVYVCEHCGASKEDWGYDDTHFHHNVIPAMYCGGCGKARDGKTKPKVEVGEVGE